MLYNTCGIVLKTFKYAETSLIAKIYTQHFGLQSYIINNVRSSKASHIKSAALQPLTLLQMVVYKNPHKDLQRVKELKPTPPLTSLPFQLQKSSIALFISEILYKTLKEEEQNEPQFEFLHYCIAFLDQTPHSCSNFHLWLMAQLSRFLGFFPNISAQTTANLLPPFFDLKEGIFTNIEPKTHSFYITDPLQKIIFELFTSHVANIHTLKINRSERQQILHILIAYYQLHVPNFGEVQSLKILLEIFES